MKIQSGGGHDAKLAHPPKTEAAGAARAQSKPRAAAQEVIAAKVRPTANGPLASSGQVGTKLHAIA